MQKRQYNLREVVAIFSIPEKKNVGSILEKHITKKH
jgi:hypothetical protein